MVTAETAEVEDRLNTLNRILNKYGRTVEETLSHRDELRRQITDLEGASFAPYWHPSGERIVFSSNLRRSWSSGAGGGRPRCPPHARICSMRW